jgi:SHS2 domain-containing protein
MHSFEDHTAEVRLRVEAPTLEGVYAETVVALAELMADDPSTPTDGESVPLRVAAPDGAALLVELVNEIVFLSETKKKVFSRARFDRVSETELRGTVEGFSAEALRTAVKAATYHDVAVERADGGWRARVVLDV